MHIRHLTTSRRIINRTCALCSGIVGIKCCKGLGEHFRNFNCPLQSNGAVKSRTGWWWENLFYFELSDFLTCVLLFRLFLMDP